MLLDPNPADAAVQLNEHQNSKNYKISKYSSANGADNPLKGTGHCMGDVSWKTQEIKGVRVCSPGLVQRRKLRVRPCKIKVIHRIPRGVACRGHSLGLAVCQGLGRDALLFLELFRGLDECDRESGGDMPLHVAVQEPNARVVRPESHDSVACRCNHHCVPLHWDTWEAGCVAVVFDDCMPALVLWAWNIDPGAAGNELHYVAMHIWVLLVVEMQAFYEPGTYGSGGPLHQGY